MEQVSEPVVITGPAEPIEGSIPQDEMAVLHERTAEADTAIADIMKELGLDAKAEPVVEEPKTESAVEAAALPTPEPAKVETDQSPTGTRGVERLLERAAAVSAAEKRINELLARLEAKDKEVTQTPQFDPRSLKASLEAES